MNSIAGDVGGCKSRSRGGEGEEKDKALCEGHICGREEGDSWIKERQ